jgi:hypothetical protein
MPSSTVFGDATIPMLTLNIVACNGHSDVGARAVVTLRADTESTESIASS